MNNVYISGGSAYQTHSIVHDFSDCDKTKAGDVIFATMNISSPTSEWNAGEYELVIRRRDTKEVVKTFALTHPVEILVDGNVQSINTVSANVRAKGSAQSVNTVSGNVMICGNVSSVMTVSGKITIGGRIEHN